MTTAAGGEPLIREVRVTKDEIVAHLADGRVISVPLASMPVTLHGTSGDGDDSADSCSS